MKEESVALIIRAVLALGRRLRAERPEGAASLATIGILATLRRLGPMPATQLASEEQLQPQSLTRLIVALENKGWIARRRSRVDRRQISIALTRRGREALADDMRARRRWLQSAMLAGLGADERAALLAASAAMLKLANHVAR
jgi:DNA-binding MarR family transcriptional regulator